MISTRTKLVLVTFGVLWFFLLVYVMSSLKWNSYKKKGENVLSSDPDYKELDTNAMHFNKQVLNLFPNLVFNKNVFPGDSKPLSNSTLKQVSYINVENMQNVSLIKPVSRETNNIKEIGIVLSGDEGTMMGIIAAINSIHSNSKSSLHFYVSLPKKLIPYFENWMGKSDRLNQVKYTVRPLLFPIPDKKPHFAKLYVLDMFPELQDFFIYIDADIIVQGDVSELLKLKFKQGQVALVPSDCNSLEKYQSLRHPFYSSHLNMSHESVKKLHINPKTCIFNTNFFVANIAEWKRKNIPNALHTFVKISEKIPTIYGVEPGCDEAEAAILLAFYNHVGNLPPLWHVGHLGEKPGSSFSSQFITKAKLLHWDGRFKPWGRRAPFSDIWHSYYVPDPETRYKPVRRHG